MANRAWFDGMRRILRLKRKVRLLRNELQKAEARRAGAEKALERFRAVAEKRELALIDKILEASKLSPSVQWSAESAGDAFDSANRPVPAPPELGASPLFAELSADEKDAYNEAWADHLEDAERDGYGIADARDAWRLNEASIIESLRG